MELEVLFADNHLLVVSKPAGEPCVPDESGDRSLLDRARAWVKREGRKPGAAYLGVVQRLDRPVSGIVVFARTSKAAARLTEAFRTRQVEKTYWAVAVGAPRGGTQGELEQWLLKDSERRRVRAVAADTPGAKRALTRWRVLGAGPDGAWLELSPATGRPHQLRVAAASLGAPLVGDLKYGAPRALPDKSVALHAHSLAFPHPVRKETVRFACAPPDRAPWSALCRTGPD